MTTNKSRQTKNKSPKKISAALKTPLAKRRQLDALLRDYGSLLIAYSGGVDSTFLAAAAGEVLGKKALAVTADSESLAACERAWASACAKRFGFRHCFVKTDELRDERYAANDENRCRYCKTALMKKLKAVSRREKIAPIALGAIADDADDIRPGEKAAAECGAVFPLKEIGFTKAEVRLLSRAMKLPTWDKPAAPCLSSRIAFGEPITAEKLKRVERAEAFLHDLGFLECRVRLHGPLARIEVPRRRLKALTAAAAKVSAQLRSCGFTYVTADLDGFRSGSLHEATGKKPPFRG
jgi:uncharacterized protein